MGGIRITPMTQRRSIEVSNSSIDSRGRKVGRKITPRPQGLFQRVHRERIQNFGGSRPGLC
jgi:hypothetical protein